MKTMFSLLLLAVLVAGGVYFAKPDLFNFATSATKEVRTNDPDKTNSHAITNSPTTSASSQSGTTTSAKPLPKAVATGLLSAIPSKPLAPDFRLADDEGEMHSLSDYKGKTVVINFWATWCPPCRAELPSMNRAWKKLKDSNVQMLAVNVGEDEDTVFAFTGEQEIDFQILLDESGEVAGKWPMEGLPTTYVLDKEGRVIYRAVGGREWDMDEIVNVIKQL